MLNIPKLKQHGEKLLEAANDHASMEQAATFIKTLEEIENQRASASKLKEEKEEILSRRKDASYSRRKEMLTAFAPLLTTIILAATLLFQFISTQESEADKRADAQRQTNLAEDNRFLEAEKFVGTSEKLSTATTLLNTFTSDHYKSVVQHQLTSLVLAKSDDEDQFRQSFSDLYSQPDWNNLPQILNINKVLSDRGDEIGRQGWDYTEHQFHPEKLNDPKKVEEYNRLLRESDLTEQSILPVLKSRPAGVTSFSLDAVSLGNLDLSGVNLSGLDIEGTNFSRVLLEKANLDGIVHCDRSVFLASPWWHASKISPELLAYLRKQYPYNSNIKNYPSTQRPLSEDEYNDAVRRLTGPNPIAAPPCGTSDFPVP